MDKDPLKEDEDESETEKVPEPTLQDARNLRNAALWLLGGWLPSGLATLATGSPWWMVLVLWFAGLIVYSVPVWGYFSRVDKAKKVRK